MVPEIQLMLRIEREARLQRRPVEEEVGDYAAYELIDSSIQPNRLKQTIDCFDSCGQTRSKKMDKNCTAEIQGRQTVFISRLSASARP